MKKTNNKGITLVALIITIVVLLILAGVAIGTLKDSNIIGYAKNAGSDYTIAQEKEQIGLAVSEWQIEKTISVNNPVLKDVITNALQGQNVSVDGDPEGPLTVTFNKTGNKYRVESNGTITPIDKEEVDSNDPVNPDEPETTDPVEPETPEPVTNTYGADWTYAWICKDGIWNDTGYVKTELTDEDIQEIESADIIAKVYLQEGVSVTPEHITFDGMNFTNPPSSENSYKLAIEGNGDIGAIGDMASMTFYGYGKGSEVLLGKESDQPNIMPYITEIKVCDGITKIGAFAFALTASLENIEISPTVEYIDSYAFFNCSKLINITIPNSVETIGAYAFQFCQNLANIKFSESLTEIGAFAFNDCNSLVNVIIPENVIKLGEQSFDGCNNIQNIYIETTSSEFSVESQALDTDSEGRTTVFVRNSIIADKISASGSTVTISTDYEWTAPEL